MDCPKTSLAEAFPRCPSLPAHSPLWRGRDELGGGWEGFENPIGGVTMRIGFWVIEGKKGELSWWFEHDVCPQTVDVLIERLDLVSRAALSFWSEEPLDPEVRSLLNRISPSLSPRAQALVKDLLV